MNANLNNLQSIDFSLVVLIKRRQMGLKKKLRMELSKPFGVELQIGLAIGAATLSWRSAREKSIKNP